MNDEPGSGRNGQQPTHAEQLQHYAQVAAIAILVVGCYLVLHPFVPALLFAAVVCSATWPLYLRLRSALWERHALSALVMSFILAVLIIGPTVLLAITLADNVAAMLESVKEMFSAGPVNPPEWLRSIPIVGDLLTEYWNRLATSRDSLATQWKGLIEPLRNLLLSAGKAVGEGMLQLVLASFIGFFFYRDGEILILATRRMLEKIAGDLGDEMLETIDSTVTGVIHGVFGTALVQGLVALIGFLVAGVPGAFLLAAATFFLSAIPIGPPIVWLGATAWLLHDGQTAWAIFMALWGLLAISSIDNLVKPYLISRSSKLPLLLIVLGLLGGVIAFGFIGIFIGPPVLAIGLTLVQLWIARRAPAEKN
jgi:predicted PurR-regulated permease PerM